MATYRDYALAAHAAAVQAEQDRLAAEKQSRVDAARRTVAPLLTDSTGKLLLDPAKLTLEHVDNSVVVLSTADGSAVSFAVQGDLVRVVQKIDGAWTGGPAVTDLDDVGAALAAG